MKLNVLTVYACVRGCLNQFDTPETVDKYKLKRVKEDDIPYFKFNIYE